MKMNPIISHISKELITRFIWDTTVETNMEEEQVLKILVVTMSIKQALSASRLLLKGFDFEKIYNTAVRGLEINEFNCRNF